MAQATGYVVLEAAQAEDTIGELITLAHRLVEAEKDPSGWWHSGEQLLNEMRALNDPALEDISETYARLYPQRNEVVHGLTLGDGGATMRRSKLTKASPGPATYAFTLMSVESRYALADEFRALEQMAAEAISRIMGIA